jgi:hypothetical protein
MGRHGTGHIHFELWSWVLAQVELSLSLGVSPRISTSFSTPRSVDLVPIPISTKYSSFPPLEHLILLFFPS